MYIPSANKDINGYRFMFVTGLRISGNSAQDGANHIWTVGWAGPPLPLPLSDVTLCRPLFPLLFIVNKDSDAIRSKVK